MMQEKTRKFIRDRIVTIGVCSLFIFAGSSVGQETVLPISAFKVFSFAVALGLGFLGCLCHMGGDRGKTYRILGIFTALIVGTTVLASLDMSNAIVPSLVFGGIVGAIGCLVTFSAPGGDDLDE